METENKPIGELFGSIIYNSNKDVENLIDNLNQEQSFYMLSLGIETGIRNNIFTIQEIEILSKSLRIMNKTIIQK